MLLLIPLSVLNAITFTHAQTLTTTAPILTLTTTLPPVATTVYTTILAPASAPPSPQYTNDLTFRTSLLNSTNLYRYEHGAPFLAWNVSLASYALSYASRCIWAHSGGPYGENLAHGYPDITTSVDAWGDERALYSFNPNNYTGFSEATGHFTQLVWKATQTVGCGAFNCDNKNGVSGWMLVCEYWPPGNVEALAGNKNQYFMQNVQSQVNNGNGYDIYRATVGATGVTGTATASASSPSVTTSTSAARQLTRTSLLMMKILMAVVSILLQS